MKAATHSSLVLPILTVSIAHEPDTVIARRRARQIARLMGFGDQDGTRIATAVSEIARNAHTYGGGGKVEFLAAANSHDALVVQIQDRGPGIANLDDILSGNYHSATGMGLGIVGARRLMDGFEMHSRAGEGTTVILRKNLPRGAEPITKKSLGALSEKLARQPHDMYEEIRQQNQDLLSTLETLRQREEELEQLNSELEDTNRGVVALYAELDQRAEQLRRADQMKSRFLSHMSHEFRTPLNSIIGLTRLLLKREPIAASEDAKREIKFIEGSAESLREIVNDLLDLSKAESGKQVVQSAEFEINDLFSALRGMMRHLATNDDVELIFDDVPAVPVVHSDESLITQILRNLISNALKFTERGKVRVSAVYLADRDEVRFSVKDTGIGIPPEHQKAVFEEYAQVNNPLQRTVKGTGLGLPLCKTLAELLGGNMRLESEPGKGALFTAVIPRVFRSPEEKARMAASGNGHVALLVDDEDVIRYLLRQLIGNSARIVEAKNGREGLEKAVEIRPDVIFLDLNMPKMNGFEVLAALRANDVTRDTPVVVVTGQTLDDNVRADFARQGAALIPKDVLAGAEALSIDFGPPLTVSPRYAKNSH